MARFRTLSSKVMYFLSAGLYIGAAYSRCGLTMVLKRCKGVLVQVYTIHSNYCIVLINTVRDVFFF